MLDVSVNQTASVVSPKHLNWLLVLLVRLVRKTGVPHDALNSQATASDIPLLKK
jgi:hypothetical protein